MNSVHQCKKKTKQREGDKTNGVMLPMAANIKLLPSGGIKKHYQKQKAEGICLFRSLYSQETNTGK